MENNDFPPAPNDPPQAVVTPRYLPDRTPTDRQEPVWSSHVTARPPRPMNWLWQGYLAPGNVTLLTSLAKTGKTTLVSVLLTKLASGGQLAGLPVRAVRTAYVSEEPEELWAGRLQRLDVGPNVAFYFQPFPQKPTDDQWQAFINHRLGRLRTERGLDLVVIDTLAFHFPAGAESQADRLQAAMRPLERLTRAGVSLLILHHPRKAASEAGYAARGTSALTALADVAIEMRLPSRNGPGNRRRRLTALSRHAETPRELMIELSADGCDYAACPDALDEEAEDGLQQVCEVLARSDTQLTRDDLLNQLPGKPSATAVWNWLTRGVELGRIVCEGAGHKGDPHRYTLTGSGALWRPKPWQLLDLDPELVDKLAALQTRWLLDQLDSTDPLDNLGSLDDLEPKDAPLKK